VVVEARGTKERLPACKGRVASTGMPDKRRLVKIRFGAGVSMIERQSRKYEMFYIDVSSFTFAINVVVMLVVYI
jgi:hypothetical protein